MQKGITYVSKRILWPSLIKIKLFSPSLCKYSILAVINLSSNFKKFGQLSYMFRPKEKIEFEYLYTENFVYQIILKTSLTKEQKCILI